MISENDVKRAYGSANPGRVIRKGDAGWTSDRPDRAGEAYGVNPLSTMEAKMAQRRVRAITPEVDPNEITEGTTMFTDDGRDAWLWVVVAESARRDSAKLTRHVWRLRYTQKNAAL